MLEAIRDIPSYRLACRIAWGCNWRRSIRDVRPWHVCFHLCRRRRRYCRWWRGDNHRSTSLKGCIQRRRWRRYCLLWCLGGLRGEVCESRLSEAFLHGARNCLRSRRNKVAISSPLYSLLAGLLFVPRLALWDGGLRCECCAFIKPPISRRRNNAIRRRGRVLHVVIGGFYTNPAQRQQGTNKF